MNIRMYIPSKGSSYRYIELYSHFFSIRISVICACRCIKQKRYTRDCVNASNRFHRLYELSFSQSVAVSVMQSTVQLFFLFFSLSFFSSSFSLSLFSPDLFSYILTHACACILHITYARRRFILLLLVKTEKIVVVSVLLSIVKYTWRRKGEIKDADPFVIIRALSARVNQEFREKNFRYCAFNRAFQFLSLFLSLFRVVLYPVHISQCLKL